MAMNIPSSSVDARKLERTSGSASTPAVPAAPTGPADSVHVSHAASAAQQGGREAKQLVTAARALGELLAKVDSHMETVARAATLVRDLARARQADRPAVLARLDDLGRSEEGKAAKVERERLGLTGTPGEKAVRAAGESLSQSHAELHAVRAQLVTEGEALEVQLSGSRSPAGLSPDRVQRARAQVAADPAAAVAAQSSQLTPAAATLLS
jgi:hypothetical protein